MSSAPRPPYGQSVTNPVDADFIKKQIDRLQNRGKNKQPGSDLPSSDDRLFRPKPDTTTTIRFLPGQFYQDADGTWYQKPFYAESEIHWLGRAQVHCPRKLKRGKCPICEYINALWTTGNQDNINLAIKLKAKPRFYLNLIQRERTVYDSVLKREIVQRNAGPLKWSMGTKLFEKILGYWVKKGVGDLTQLESGLDFDVYPATQGQDYTNYEKSEAGRERCDAGTPEEIDKWMNDLNDLEGDITLKPYNEMLTMLKEHLDQSLGRNKVSDEISRLSMPAQAAVPARGAQETGAEDEIESAASSYVRPEIVESDSSFDTSSTEDIQTVDLTGNGSDVPRGAPTPQPGSDKPWRSGSVAPQARPQPAASAPAPQPAAPAPLPESSAGPSVEDDQTDEQKEDAFKRQLRLAKERAAQRRAQVG